jgi:hypothetical protein
MLQELFISFYYDIVFAPAKPYLQPVEFGAIEPEMPNPHTSLSTGLSGMTVPRA